jgi:hypothetical protein
MRADARTRGLRFINYNDDLHAKIMLFSEMPKNISTIIS